MLNHNLSFDKVRNVFFFSMIIGLSIAVLYLFRPFVYPIFWAAVIAVMFHPLYRWLGDHFKSAGLRAWLTLVAVIAVILFPLILLSTIIVNQSINLYQSITAEDVQKTIDVANDWLGDTPVGSYLEAARDELPTHISNIAKKASTLIFTSIKSITQNSFRFVLMLFVMFYTLFYFLKDGENILRRLMHFVPLGDEYETMLYERFTSTTRATLKSTIIVGGIQGILSSILFWITGIQGAFIWGVVMVIIAIIPAVGPSIILLPAGITMLLLGNTWQGVVILVGAGVVGVVDNLLRPSLVGKDIQMHPLMVFFATLGGIILFGISGFVIGPIVAALYISVMSIYDHYYKHELEKN